MRGLGRERTMPKAFSPRVGAMDLLRMTIARATFACMLGLGVAAPKMALAKDNPQWPSPRAMP